jgi:hypothetical protein
MLNTQGDTVLDSAEVHGMKFELVILSGEKYYAILHVESLDYQSYEYREEAMKDWELLKSGKRTPEETWGVLGGTPETKP